MKSRRTVRAAVVLGLALSCPGGGLEARGRGETAYAPSLLVSEGARMETAVSLGIRAAAVAAVGERLAVLTADRSVLLLHPATGEQSTVRGGPAICTALASLDGALFCGGADGMAYRIGESGSKAAWQANLEAAVTCLSASNGTLYAGLADGRMAALRASDGSVLWRLPASAAAGKPVALRAAGALLLAVFEDGSGRVTCAVLRAHDGALSWTAAAQDRFQGAAANGAGTVYLTAGSQLLSVEEKDLDSLSAAARPVWTLPAGEHFVAGPEWRDGLLFLATQRRIFGWNVRTGETVWEIWTDVRDSVAGFVSSGNRVTVATRDGLVGLAVLGPQALTASSTPKAISSYVASTAAAWEPLDKAMEILTAATAAAPGEEGIRALRAGLQEASLAARRAMEAFQTAAPKDPKTAELNRKQIEACRTFLDATETFLETGDARAIDGVLALDTGLKPAYREVVMQFATETQVSFLSAQPMVAEREQKAAEDVAEALVGRDGLERTIQRLEKALEENPRSVAILVTLSSLYGRKGMTAKEYKLIERVEEMVKENPRIVFNLTTLYGRRDAIKTEMIRGLKNGKGVRKTALYALQEGESIIPGMSVAFPGPNGYSYTLTVATAKGRSVVTPTVRKGPFDEISSVSTSPDHARWMALTRSGDAAYIRTSGGEVVGPFTDVYSADFSPDSEHWAVVGRTPEGESLLAMSGGLKVGPFAAVARPVFSADGTRTLTAVKDTTGTWFLITEAGERIGAFYGVGAMGFLPGSADWVSAVRDEEDRWHLRLSSGEILGPYEGVYGFAAGPRRGSGAAFVRNYDGSVSAILADGTVFGGFRGVENYGFSPDGSYLAAAIELDDGWYFIRHAGFGAEDALLTWMGPYRRPVGFLSSDADPTAWLFAAESEDGKTWLYAGDESYGPFDDVSLLSFLPDGRTGVVSTLEGERWYAYLGEGTRVGPFSAVYGAAFPGATAGAGDRWSLHVLTADGTDSVVTERERYDVPAGGDVLLATAANRACWSTMTARPEGATETRSVFFDGEEYDAEAFDLRFTRLGDAGVYTWLTLEGGKVFANALE